VPPVIKRIIVKIKNKTGKNKRESTKVVCSNLRLFKDGYRNAIKKNDTGTIINRAITSKKSERDAIIIPVVKVGTNNAAIIAAPKAIKGNKDV